MDVFFTIDCCWSLGVVLSILDTRRSSMSYPIKGRKGCWAILLALVIYSIMFLAALDIVPFGNLYAGIGASICLYFFLLFLKKDSQSNSIVITQQQNTRETPGLR